MTHLKSSLAALSLALLTAAPASAAAPTVFTNLGTISFVGGTFSAPVTLTTVTGSFAANEVKWYMFTTTEAVGSPSNAFLDIFTHSANGKDTELVLFDASGVLVKQNDDFGGSLSMLSFGPGTSRDYSGLGVPVAPDFSGTVALQAGDYWLAAGVWDLIPGITGTDWNVISTAAATGSYSFTLGSGGAAPVPEPTTAVTGLLSLALLATRRRR